MLKKAKKYTSADHVVIRTEGQLKKNWSGTVLGWNKVVQHLGFNRRDKSVYLCRDIFGREFTACANVFTHKWFERCMWLPDSYRELRKLRQCYGNMLKRCYSANSLSSKYYHGRGVKVVDEWLGDSGFFSFVVWAAKSGYRLGLTIDRTDKHYSPDSCRWIEQKENNRFTSRTRLTWEVVTEIRAEYAGYSGQIKQFCKAIGARYGVSFEAIRGVLNNSRWPVEQRPQLLQ